MMSKLLRELRADDFEQSKVWEYRGNSDETATAEPSSQKELAEDDGHVYLVLTEFRLADGTTLHGFSSPTDDSGLDYVQPVIFHGGDQLMLWRDDRDVENVSQALGRESTDVYPIYWKSVVLIDGEDRTGFITV
jgi:hypothetical protein